MTGCGRKKNNVDPKTWWTSKEKKQSRRIEHKGNRLAKPGEQKKENNEEDNHQFSRVFNQWEEATQEQGSHVSSSDRSKRGKKLRELESFLLYYSSVFDNLFYDKKVVVGIGGT